MKVCPRCRAQNHDQILACWHCGLPLPTSYWTPGRIAAGCIGGFVVLAIIIGSTSKSTPTPQPANESRAVAVPAPAPPPRSVACAADEEAVERISAFTGDTVRECRKVKPEPTPRASRSLAAERGAPGPKPRTELDEAREVHRELARHLVIGRGEMARLRAQLRRDPDDLAALRRCGELMRASVPEVEDLRKRAGELDTRFRRLRAAGVGVRSCVVCVRAPSTEDRCREAAADLAKARSALK